MRKVIELTEKEIMETLESVFGKDPDNESCLECIKAHMCDCCSAYEYICEYNHGIFDWLDVPYTIVEDK